MLKHRKRQSKRGEKSDVISERKNTEREIERGRRDKDRQRESVKEKRMFDQK